MQTGTRIFSVRRMVLIGFIVTLVSSITAAGYLVYTRWLSSTENMMIRISEDISDSIYDKVNTLIHTSEHFNEVNHSVITNGILDIREDEKRDKFFVHALKAHGDEVYSFSYGTADGEYYGARRNEDGIIEIMKNNDTTGGHSWYYEVREDQTAGEVVYAAGKFDPRTRQWYKIALDKGKPSYSSVYKHFVMDDLTISASWPIYDGEDNFLGVMGTHMLLTDMDTFLEEAMSKYHGQAIIVEQESGALIANSMSLDNYQIQKDGTVKRYDVSEIDRPDFQRLYEECVENQDGTFLYDGEEETLFVHTRSIAYEGLNWVVISALPESLYMSDIRETMLQTTFMVMVLVLGALLLFKKFSKKMMRPIDELLAAAAALASGDLSQRVKITRYDELGKLSKSFNHVANQMSYLVGNLEEAVDERTNELHHAYETISESREELQLILDSAKEAIMGIDEKGVITFLNRSCLEMLGYEELSELIGSEMHAKVHYRYQDGSHFDLKDCRIFKTVQLGVGVSADDEVFWRKDGTCFQVEYNSYPQKKDGKVMGVVVTFTDITEKKKIEKEISYLTYHDSLTGLYNRTGFEKRKHDFDNEDHLPLGVLFGDLNGLKMTNDIFGHEAGDRLLKKAAEVLSRSCRGSDVIARIGGDEFIILLPNTTKEEAQSVLARIGESFSHTKIDAIKCSMALGIDLKSSPSQSLDEIITNAENKMYKDKTEHHKSTSRDILNNIIETLHEKNPEEKRHSVNTMKIAREIGAALKLKETDLLKLEKTAYLHDIGKIVGMNGDNHSTDGLNEESETMMQHASVGFRILTMFEDTMDLAEYVYYHHEKWDGQGYPRGIKGDRIPLLSRIISVAEVFERICFREERTWEEGKAEAIQVMINESGKRFDPVIVEAFLGIADSLELS